ncbi:MAG: GNAT family N-acetyltransferase [Desulfobacteraceae bacterium]|nr:GNAT family N-acetyltransferase [Desulfobacteraceae bacterium]
MELMELKKYLDQIVDLKMAMFREAGRIHLLADDAREIVKRTYQQMYEEDKASHFLEFDRNEIIAMAGVFIKEDLPYCYYKGHAYGFIGDVYVRPDFRKRGIATLLSQSCLDWFRKKNITVVRLLSTEAAKPVYEKMGFKPTDEMMLNL